MKPIGWAAIHIASFTACAPALACDKSPEPPQPATVVAPAVVERSSLRTFSKSARLVPLMRGDRLYGIKVYSADPEGPIARLGLQSGDVVTAINGLQPSTPDTWVQMYERLKDASTFQVQFERDGKVMMGSLTVR